MTIVSDATALILLSKAGLLEIFIEKNKITIPPSVFQEVLKGKEKGRIDAMQTEILVEQKKINVVTPSEKLRKKINTMLNLKKGELDVVSVAFQKKYSILSDDKKCLNSAKALKIEYMTSLDITIALWKKKIINKQKALESINKLEDFGWYSKELINNYLEVLK